MEEPGIYMRHVHTEPGSELSIPGEDSICVMPTTVLGGYGHVHEDVFVRDGGIIAPGFASLMEHDCQTPWEGGRLSVHNLTMEQYSILRLSVGRHNVNGESVLENDVVTVHGTLNLRGKINVLVLPEMSNFEEGSYLFFEYDDLDGASIEYVKNLILLEDRYGDTYYYIDYTTIPGKVYLRMSKVPPTGIQRYVDLPAIEGVIYNYVNVNGERGLLNVGRNYVRSHEDFEMNLTWTGAPLRTWATGFYSQTDVDLDLTAKMEADGSITYVIRQVVQPWTIHFGPEFSSVVGNVNMAGEKVWAYRNALYINTPVEDVVSIYNVTGVLNRKVTVPSGLNRLPLEKGMYVVTLKDGKVYKIVVQ
jgi:hypothetical protein